jgi:tetratricopeptide (TPR) repeat protein
VNANLQRALLLFDQSRHELAETELRQALAVDPHEPFAHSLLSLCLAEREQFQEATEEARQAVHLSPDSAFAHYALAKILHLRNRNEEALAALSEALRLDSSEAGHFALLAGIHIGEKRWRGALEAAERGLQIDSEHLGCTNLRAIALVKLGRRAEADATIEAALAKSPENALTHANQGWTLLERGDAKRALEHFREALRLDPENDWARHGIIEALKARHFLYAFMLRYFFWMSRLSTRAQWGVIVGGYVGSRILAGISRNNPRLAPWTLPLQIFYVLFVLLTWTADPLFNLLLRLNRFGRLALSREKVVASNWIGSCLLLSLAFLIACCFTGFASACLIGAFVFGFMIVPLAGTFRCEAGWPRKSMAAYTGLMAVAGIAALIVVALDSQAKPSSKASDSLAAALISLFFIGVIGSSWVANILISQRPKR